jgi:putative N-acetylmannosamine-6-phosphate epimerase
MNEAKRTILEQLKGGLIVSCQTQPGDVIHNGGQTVVIMAKAAE